MPLNSNIIAIQTVTVGAGGAATIDFTSIPQTYTDLVVKFSVRNTGNNAGMAFRFNSDTGANYSYRVLYGTGAAVSSFSQTVGAGYNTYLFAYTTPSSATASTFGNGEIYIPNYAGSTNKSSSVDSVSENNGTTGYQSFTAGLWSNTAAITSIQLLSDPGGASSNFAQYSTATLYGVTSVATAAKATGGIITMDDNYFYHTFLASGTFTPTQSLTADYLVVAGGGGGGCGRGGGGGGGGYLTSSLTLAATSHTVTVGAGGAGAGTFGAGGSNGSNSVFSSITATGGGGGGAYGPVAGANGGSGGGGGGTNTTPTAGGTATSGQGNNGGTGVELAGGGGGGAGAVGGNGVGAGTGGNGGNGSSSSISGTSVTYAGGGGGGSGTAGTGGTGGGGAGSIFTGSPNATAGTTNTGGGGGGGAAGANVPGAGGAGGSGIVIVRYAK